MINLRTALRNALATWRQYRADRDEEAIQRRVDTYTEEFERAVKRAIALTREEAERAAADEPAPEMPWHPLTHQQRPVNPERYPAAVSLEDAARRLIEDQDNAVLEVVGDEDTGPLPRHLARSGWSA